MAVIKPLSMTAQTAWQDLLRLLREEQVSTMRGTPIQKMIRGKPYWFDKYRLGTDTKERYIGPATPELSDMMERQRELQNNRKTAKQERSRLVRLLRSEGLMASDMSSGQMLSAMAHAGVFRLGGTLVGTQAFRLYEGVIGVHLGADAVATTNDYDIASFQRLSFALKDAGDAVEPAIGDVLKDFHFDPVPTLGRGSTWKWRQTNQQTLVEFLAPCFDDSEGRVDLPALGVSAQSLHFLNYLIAAPIHVPLLYRDGALIQVPAPARFAVHKLIISERRRDGPESLKARKDRAQASLMMQVLAQEDPYALIEAVDDARDRGRSWVEKFKRGLDKTPLAAAALERARSEI